MNWDQIAGQWKQFKGKAKEKWGKLTDDEIDIVEGKRDQLVGKIQQRYGIAKDEAEKEVDAWAKGSKPTRVASCSSAIVNLAKLGNLRRFPCRFAQGQ